MRLKELECSPGTVRYIGEAVSDIGRCCIVQCWIDLLTVVYAIVCHVESGFW